MKHPRFLNAEDDETRGPLEVAIDLVLLHPGLKMGVLRGDPVEHPKYAGRRIFSSGINLTRLYHGKISYLFYLVRDLGLVHKLYRGLALEAQSLDGLETTLEKPWMAVVDGFAIGGGCQILLVVDYVIAENGSYFNLPARKEGIIPGAANLRLPRFMGERMARQAILFDRLFRVEEPDAKATGERGAPAGGDRRSRRARGRERPRLGHGERLGKPEGSSRAARAPGHVPALHGDLRARAGLLSSQRAADRKPGETLASEESEVMK